MTQKYKGTQFRALSNSINTLAWEALLELDRHTSLGLNVQAQNGNSYPLRPDGLLAYSSNLGS